MDSRSENSRTEKRSTIFNINVDARNHLLTAYNNGLTSYGSSERKQQLRQLCESTGISQQDAKAYIKLLNKRQIRKAKKAATTSASEQAPAAPLPQVSAPVSSADSEKSERRKPSALAQFRARRLPELGHLPNMASKQSVILVEYANMSPGQKAVYEELAKKKHCAPLTEDEKKKLVKKMLGEIEKKVNKIRSLTRDIELAFVYVKRNKPNNLEAHGSNNMKTWLKSNIDTLPSYLHGCDKPVVVDLSQLRGEVREVFNAAYKRAFNIKRVSYKNLGNKRCVGLPDGIVFKEPAGYGAKACQQILDAKHQIVFIESPLEPPSVITFQPFIDIDGLTNSTDYDLTLQTNQQLTEETDNGQDLIHSQAVIHHIFTSTHSTNIPAQAIAHMQQPKISTNTTYMQQPPISVNTTHNIQQPLNTTHNLQQTANTMNNIQQPANTTHNIQQPLNTTHNIQQPLNTTHNISQPANTTHNIQQPENTTHNLQQTANTTHNIQQSVYTTHNVQQSANTTHNIQQPLNTTLNIQQSANTTHNLQQPTDKRKSRRKASDKQTDRNTHTNKRKSRQKTSDRRTDRHTNTDECKSRRKHLKTEENKDFRIVLKRCDSVLLNNS